MNSVIQHSQHVFPFDYSKMKPKCRVPATLKMMLIHVIIFILTGIGYPATKHSTNYSTSTIKMTIGWSALHPMEIESFYTVYEITRTQYWWKCMKSNATKWESTHSKWRHDEEAKKNRYVKQEVKKRPKMNEHLMWFSSLVAIDLMI